MLTKSLETKYIHMLIAHYFIFHHHHHQLDPVGLLFGDLPIVEVLEGLFLLLVLLHNNGPFKI